MLVTTAILTSLAAFAADVRTVDATEVPVLSMTQVVKQEGPRNIQNVCAPDRGRNADPVRIPVRFSIETDGTTSDVTIANALTNAVAVGTRPCAGETLRAVRGWTFEPPVLNGEPVRIENVESYVGFAPWRAARGD